jgi:hypothetical protein
MDREKKKEMILVVGRALVAAIIILGLSATTHYGCDEQRFGAE